MTALLHRPLPPAFAALAATGVTAAVAIYCLAYSALTGSSESVGEAVAWAAINVAPWVLALEAGKRGSWPAALAGGFLVSMLLGALWSGTDNLAFEAARRILLRCCSWPPCCGSADAARHRRGARRLKPNPLCTPSRSTG